MNNDIGWAGSSGGDRNAELSLRFTCLFRCSGKDRHEIWKSFVSGMLWHYLPSRGCPD